MTVLCWSFIAGSVTHLLCHKQMISASSSFQYDLFSTFSLNDWVHFCFHGQSYLFEYTISLMAPSSLCIRSASFTLVLTFRQENAHILFEIDKDLWFRSVEGNLNSKSTELCCRHYTAPLNTPSTDSTQSKGFWLVCFVCVRAGVCECGPEVKAHFAIKQISWKIESCQIARENEWNLHLNVGTCLWAIKWQNLMS